ncbi:MAG: PP0621 family protein [Lautropia sp.]|nr:PP0621 family protein [Lautropia sp.]
MGKIIFWILIGMAALALFRHFGAAARRRRNAAGAARPAQTDDAAASRAPTHDVMLACHVCRVHLPASEALFAHGRVYCCQAHMDSDRLAHADRELR